MSTTETPFYTQPELQPELRKPSSKKLPIVLAVLVGVLVLSLTGATVALVNGHSKYDTLSTKYDTQANQVKDLTGQAKDLSDQAKDLKYQLSTVREQARLGQASARAAVLMSHATNKLLVGFQKDVFSQLIYLQEANTFVDRAYRIAKANGYPDINSLFRAAAAAGVGTTL